MNSTARRLTYFFLAALLLWAQAAWADTAPGSLVGKVREHRLDNGMVVLALARPGAPVVSLQMAFRVGAVDEESGSTGMAHLLEHMLFKGTRTLGTRDWASEQPLLEEIESVGSLIDEEKARGEHADPQLLLELAARLATLQKVHRSLIVEAEIDGIYSRQGAVGFNASTSTDMTNYFVSLPSNRIELWAAVESDRMREPVLRQFFIERDVVMEERKKRRDTQPSGRLYEALMATAFTAHPYRNPVIGWPADIQALNLSLTRDFYKRHYGPDNVVVAAVGDVEPDEFFALMERYFGDIEARGMAERPPTAEPPQEGPRRVEVFFDAEPRAALAYHKPTLPHRDDYVFDVISAILGEGRTSRLWRELVERRKVAISVAVSNGLPGARFGNLFGVFVTPAQGIDPDAALAAVREEFARLAAEPPDTVELEKVITNLEADRVRAMISDAGLARRLAYYQTVAGDWRYIEELPRVLAGITPEEVSAAVAKYLVPSNETTALLRPGGDK